MQLFRTLCFSGLLGLLITGSSPAEEYQKPFVLAYIDSSSIENTTPDIIDKITDAGFEVVGDYSPYDGAAVIVFTDDALKKAAAGSEKGGYAAAQRAAVTRVGEEIQVSYTNPVYWGNAYRLDDITAMTAVARRLESALGKERSYGTGKKELTAEKLRKYHYMFGMEYFDDPSELAEYENYEAAVEAVEKGLSAGRGGAGKVYRIDPSG